MAGIDGSTLPIDFDILDEDLIVFSTTGYADDIEPEPNPSIIGNKCMNEDAIHYFDKPSMKKHAKVPPPTPDYDIDYQRPITLQPLDIERVAGEELPQVSNEGIRFSIAALGKILDYNAYEYDLIQFWLLDILTDCLWKAQDVFMFEEKQQKLILEWVTAIFKLIADPELNLSRKNFLLLLKDILFGLYKHVARTSDAFPAATFIEVFVQKMLNGEQQQTDANESTTSEDDDDDDSHSSANCAKKTASVSTFSINSTDARRLSINPEFDIQKHINYLKQNNPLGNLVHAYSDSRMQSVTSLRSAAGEGMDAYVPFDMNFDDPCTVNTFPFWLNYKPFKKIDHVCGCQLSPSKIYCTCVDRYLMAGEDRDRDLDYDKLFVDIEQLRSDAVPCKSAASLSSESTAEVTKVADVVDQTVSNQVFNYLTNILPAPNIQPPAADVKGIDDAARKEEPIKEDEEKVGAHEEELEHEKEVEIVREWAYFKLMEQRNWDMDDTKVGWVPWASWLEGQPSAMPEVPDMLELAEEETKSEKSGSIPSAGNDVRKLNFNILKAITDFVFEYFYENFHFTIIKFAFRCPPNLITQTINTEWNIPKVIKSQFKRPKPAKQPKPKKQKGDKASKKSKSSKGSKSKKSKSSKKSKDKGKKKKDKKKAEKKGKSKLTPEEKAELERQRLEAERLEEERQQAEENRVYMFPLADAASETLFMSVFENWVKVTEKGGKKKKEKKGKDKKKGKKK